MYIGVLSVWFGEAILFHSLLLAGCGVLIALMVHLFVVLYEEPTLRRQFGEAYETYLWMVSRWLPRYPHS
jgi:protein-S-isoprenylcysteine O-methyltransferase Ste14